MGRAGRITDEGPGEPGRVEGACPPSRNLPPDNLPPDNPPHRNPISTFIATHFSAAGAAVLATASGRLFPARRGHRRCWSDKPRAKWKRKEGCRSPAALGALSFGGWRVPASTKSQLAS